VGRARRPARSLLAILALLALASCSERDDLDGTSWLAVNLGPRPTVPEVRSTIAFEGGEVSGRGGCNTYTGIYEADPASPDGGQSPGISITNVGGTEMACEDLVMAQEAAFYAALLDATHFRLVQDRLELLDDEGETLAALVRTDD
jgi:putative lipoprotein